MVIWITGLSGAGKTTLCEAVRALVKPRMPELVLLDGDVVRSAFGNDLSYREADRVVQIKRMQGLAAALERQGLVVLVAALYASPELLAWNRQNFADYFEIYVEAPLDLLRRRDTKALYRTAESGERRDVVGVDIPWHAPARPDMVIDAARGEPPEQLALRLIAAVPRLAAPPASSRPQSSAS